MNLKAIEITKDVLKEIYKERPRDARRYHYGLLLIIGGSQFYSGPPAFAGLSAYRAGVDVVRIIAPKRAADIIASFSPLLAAYPLEGNLLTKGHLATLLSMTEAAKAVTHGKTAVLIGGGLGRTEETQKTIIEYLSNINIPAVIDADAIRAVAEAPECFRGKPFLFTSHNREFSILTGKDIYESPEEEKIETVKREAERLQTTILWKGPEDIVSDGKEVAINRTGSPYMSKGGTGDTLAGIAGAIMARNIPAFVAGQAAAFINGKAGEVAAEKLKESLYPTDIIDEITNVINQPG